MNQYHTVRPHHGREQKRAQFAGSEGSKRKKALPLIIIGVIGIGAYVLGGNLGGQPEATPVAAPAAAENTPAGAAVADNHLAIPLADVSSGEAEFFQFVSSDKRAVRFFIIKASDGEYRAALDACDVCYRARKGYRQSGDDMVCVNCGRHFPSANVNILSGGCNPVPLTRTVAGDKLLIKTAELETMSAYF